MSLPALLPARPLIKPGTPLHPNTPPTRGRRTIGRRPSPPAHPSFSLAVPAGSSASRMFPGRSIFIRRRSAASLHRLLEELTSSGSTTAQFSPARESRVCLKDVYYEKRKTTYMRRVFPPFPPQGPSARTGFRGISLSTTILEWYIQNALVSHKASASGQVSRLAYIYISLSLFRLFSASQSMSKKLPARFSMPMSTQPMTRPSSRRMCSS